MTQLANVVEAKLPTSVNILPQGHYLAYAMVDDIPSVAKVVRSAGLESRLA